MSTPYEGLRMPIPANAKRRTSSPHPPQQQQQQARGRYSLGCGLGLSFVLLLLIAVFVCSLVWFLVLKSENDDLKKRIKSLETLHTTAITPQQQQQQMTGRTQDDDFEQLLRAGKQKVTGDDRPSVTRLSETALSNNKNTELDAALLAKHARLHEMEESFYTFTVSEEDSVAEGSRAVRVPKTGSIDNLVFDRLITFTVCCRVDYTKMTCPTEEQIGVIVRSTPELEEYYLKVLIRNEMYFGKPCIFYWTMVPQDEKK